MRRTEEQEAWTVDQVTKSGFFHQKLHDWGLLEVAEQVEATAGEELDWELGALGISEAAWKAVIHRGVKPVTLFAHPQVLKDVPRSVAYYRMLAMVSQKSMDRVGLRVARYESGGTKPDGTAASAIARHLNTVVSALVEQDRQVNPRELDLWRGMAAGSQAQGAWQNAKGTAAEDVVKDMLRKRLRDAGLVSEERHGGREVRLKDGRVVKFADEPDVTVLRGTEPLAAVEIKGGIDTAGVLERLGAALKSLRRVRDVSAVAATILVLHRLSLTKQAERELEANRQTVTHWFAVEDVLGNQQTREELFRRLGI